MGFEKRNMVNYLRLIVFDDFLSSYNLKVLREIGYEIDLF